MQRWLVVVGLAAVAAAGAWFSGVVSNAPPAARSFAAFTPPPPPADTLSTAGPQTLHLKVVEYEGGPALLDWTNASGKTFTLAGVFKDVNVNVVIDRPPKLKNLFKPGQPLQPEELHAFQTASAPADGGGWQVTAFMMPVARSSGDLGEMFDVTTRRQFAVYGPAHSGPDRTRRLLQTAAHELGHALNLFHSDGDGDVLCCARQSGATLTGHSVMNAERCLAPGAEAFMLSPAESAHILHHPIDAIRPGSGIAWDKCPWPQIHRDRC